MNPPSWAHHAYQRSLRWHHASEGKLSCRVYERVITLLTRGWMRATGTKFPRRAIGGWLWIWRFRFEILTGLYEWGTAWWSRRLMQPGMIVMDVGAHIGYYSQRFSRWVGPSGFVAAFEASPENVPVLKQNLRLAGRTNVDCIYSAVTDHVGQVDLHISTGHSNHSLIEGYASTGKTVAVPAITLDAYAERQGLPNIDLIKSDTEGGELAVLTGASRIIHSNPQLAMIIELNPRALPAGGHSPADLVDHIRSYGFSLWEIQPDERLTPVSLTEPRLTRNLLCLTKAHRLYPLAHHLALEYDGALKEQEARR